MYKVQYSGLDRALHRLAFSSWGLQAAMSDIEDSIFRSQLAEVAAQRPVFITALPRAGTTLLLDLLVDTGEFGTHTYRQMPFLLCPMLWDGFSRRFRKGALMRERAHGDGVLVSEDSPEAFEEVIWRQYWKRYYKDSHIEPWGKVRHPGFEKFFTMHMRKIIALGSGEASSADNSTPRRYLSKNNLNISRARYLTRAFPDSVVIVLYRDPYQHADSLLRQHANFLQYHAEDAFSRRYMEGIGHYDFGANLRPVNFGNWAESVKVSEAMTIEYWLRYWHACYQHLLSESLGCVHFYSFDAICKDTVPALRSIARQVGLADPETLVSQSGRIDPPGPGNVTIDSIDPGLCSQIDALREELDAAASFAQQ